MSRLARLSGRALVALVASAAFVISSPAAVAQSSGQSTVNITMPDIVVLHYFKTINVSISQTELGTWLTASNPVDEGTSTTSGGFTQDLDITPTESNDPTAAVLTLENAWAVRAIAKAGNTDTQLEITLDTATLAGPAAGTDITISNPEVSDGTSTGATIQFAAPGIGAPLRGNVNLTLNLSGATVAGQYTGGQFTLTATNL